MDSWWAAGGAQGKGGWQDGSSCVSGKGGKGELEQQSWDPDAGTKDMMMNMMFMMMSMMKGKGKGDSGKKGGDSGKKGGASSFGPVRSGGGSALSQGGTYMAAFQDMLPATEEEIEAFLAIHSVEPHAADKLRQLDRKMARVVLMRGSMHDARDQTAVLIQRCSGLFNLKEGDWICPGCYDHQFSKNSICRKCSTPRTDYNVEQTFGCHPAVEMVEPAAPQEVDAFLAVHPGIQPHAMAKLKSMDPRMQRVVINKGSMADARDPTAVLMQRCSALTALSPGDWICFSCYDHQFSKNSACRRCGTPKPF